MTNNFKKLKSISNSLSQVIRQDKNCPKVYKDARSFFEATYLTNSPRELLEDVLKGLSGQGGDRVLQLRTPFGGGKTHSLVSLYHLTQHRDELTGISQLNTL
jgi:predicted AAA+ superfamily ATPase